MLRNLSAHQPGIAALGHQRRPGFMTDAQDGGDFRRAARLEQQRCRAFVFAAPLFQMRRDLRRILAEALRSDRLFQPVTARLIAVRLPGSGGR